MSVIHFVGGEKGGVGKSVQARLLCQYFIDRQRPLVALDADRSHPTLTRSYADYAYSMDLEDFASADQVMELALARDHQIVVDLPAQSRRLLARWSEQSDFFSMAAEHDVGIHYWFVVDDGPDATKLAAQFLSARPTGATTTLVMNEGRGEDFTDVEALLDGGTRGPGGVDTCRLPALDAGTMRRIERGNLSYWAAAHAPGDVLGVMQSRRAKVWLTKAYANLEAALA